MSNSFLKKMVWENDFESLHSCIERTIRNVETILLWQPEGDNTKKKHEAFIQKFFEDQGVLQLSEVDQKDFCFIENEDVYIRFNDRCLLFKAKIRKLSRDKIQIVLPRKFRIIENRIHSRSNIIGEELKVRILLEKRIKREDKYFDFEVLDLNRNGIGVIFSITKINNFSVGQKIFLSKFGDVTLDEEIECEIVHITKTQRDVELMTSREYKMGLKFLGEVPFFINSYEG